VIAGCAVQCPWHGSQFDVKTGRVIAGPAEDKITVYHIRISSGEVWVVPKGDRKPEKKSESKSEEKVA
jgi:nitrite reductase/ring-hydroxylating ferredoxin subunit